MSATLDRLEVYRAIAKFVGANYQRNRICDALERHHLDHLTKVGAMNLAQAAVRSARGAASKLNAAVNYDFCPWANRYVYWLRQPIGWFLAGSGAAAAIALFLTPQAWIIFGSLVVVTLVGVGWPWLSIRGVRAELDFSRQRCSEGERVDLRLKIENRWPWPLWGLAVEDGLLDTSDPVASLGRLQAWSKSEFLVSFHPQRRGKFPQTVPKLATTFPFGILRSYREVEVTRHLLVWPQTVDLNSIPSLGTDVLGMSGVCVDRPGDEADVLGARPFRAGDRLRNIHWAQSARRDFLIVNERQAMTRRLISVGLDLAAYRERPKEELETAIRVAASVIRALQSHHAQVRFSMGDEEIVVLPGTIGTRRFLDFLAEFRVQETEVPNGRESGPAASIIITTSNRMLAIASERHRTRSKVIAVGGHEVEGQNGQSAWIRVSESAAPLKEFGRKWERACYVSATA